MMHYFCTPSPCCQHRFDMQEELESISEELRIPGSKPLGPISKVSLTSFSACIIGAFLLQDAQPETNCADSRAFDPRSASYHLTAF